MIGIVLVVMFFYWLGSVGIIRLVCSCFGWDFSIWTATGVWLITNYIIGTVQRKVKKNDGK